MLNNSRKGQGIIIEILAFSMSVMLALVVFIVMISTGNVQEHQVSQSIDYKLGELRKRSVISITMNDKMWRADSISKGEYGNLPAYKVMSYYFSTPGDTVYIYDSSKPKSEVKNDIDNYLKYQMDKYWQTGPNDVDYMLDVTNPGSSSRPSNITVKTYSPTGRASKIVYPLGLTNGTAAEITLWTTTSQGIFSVGGTD